jgi:tRNA U34 5-carboxymethylaminomethyl modifying enzyme MnmG/GidA
MKIPLISTLFAALTLLVSCQHTPPTPPTPSWLKTVDHEVHRLGTFNWVIIAEPSFPALSRTGVTTITTPVSTIEALDGVLQSIDSHSHVRPRIHLTREAGAVIEHDTPGIDDYRTKLKQVLNERDTLTLTNNTLNLLITDAQKNYRILVIKTTTSLPYTSVFLELESGYWDGVSETALRKRLKR